MSSRGLRIGRDPIDRVFLIENHDQACQIWRDAGARARILLHVDAHHDMWWTPDAKLLHIANYVCRALQENIVKEVFWVVPDGTWEGGQSRRAVLRHLRKIAKQYRDARAPRSGQNQITAAVLGKPLTVCSLDSLPPIEECVLLDLDVDFLTIPRVSYGELDEQGALPWCWPEDLLARLRERNLWTDLVTVAYSIEGGYTPLKWKYLGDELALRLKLAGNSDLTLQGTALIREAAVAAQRDDFPSAEEKYRQAHSFLPASPAPLYHLAQLYLDMGRTTDAKTCCRQALDRDPSYRTAYNSAGPRYYWDRRFPEAEREHRRTLALDPEDAYAHFGLGAIAADRKRWQEAEAWFRKALALDPNLTDAYRGLGDVLVKQGRHDEAVTAYEESLKLALAGHRPLGAAIGVMFGSARPSDPDHGRILARLARLYERKGATNQAISRYRLSLAAGYDGFFLRSRLACLYGKQKQWLKCAQEAWQAVKVLPRDAGKAARRALRRLRRRAPP